MEEIIYKIDNWSIIKLLGGTAVLLIAVITFLSKALSSKIENAISHGYDKKLENIKGGIEKNNNFLNSIIQNYFSSSQKILDKKILAYETLWNSIIDMRSKIPSAVLLVHQLISEDELNDKNAFEKLDKNGTIGTLLRSYDSGVETMKMVGDNELSKYKPYFSDHTYKLFYTYRAFIGRVTHSFLYEYQKKQIYNWKKDDSLLELLKVTINEQELKYIFEIKLDSFTRLVELMEYKILQDIREAINIKDSEGDSIRYLKDIEKILRP